MNSPAPAPAATQQKLGGISAIFPVHNDAATIVSMVVVALMTLRECTDDFEVIVVNDGSTDHTGELLAELGRVHGPQLRVIDHAGNRGYGAALRSGFAAASKEWVFYTDGDGQYDPHELRLLVNECLVRGQAVDVVNGYKIGHDDPWYRHVVGWVYHQIIQRMFGFRLRDVDCDFRLIKRAVLAAIPLRSDSGTISLELVKRLQDAGCRFAEVPIHHLHRAVARSPFFHLARIGRSTAQLLGLWHELVWRGGSRQGSPAHASEAGAGGPPSGADPADASTVVAARSYLIMREVEDAHWWYDGMEVISRALLDSTVGAGTPPGRTVLDAGCGTGRNLRFLARYGEVTGMDYSSVALECCRQRGMPRLVLGSVNELPFPDASFDLVTSFDVYVMGGVVDTQALQESARVLRPGGYLLVRVAAYDQLRGRHDEEWNVHHRYERAELCGKMAAAGFEVRRASYANMWLFPVALAKRLLERIFPPTAGASDLQIGAGKSLTGRLMGGLLASEARWANRPGGGLPFGLSLYVIGQKKV